MTPESADVMRDNLLPHMEASRHKANQRIARIPTDGLATRPVAEGDRFVEAGY